MASTPNTTSSDHAAMLPYWDMVETILEGAQAMRDAGEVYLPKFENESPVHYEERRSTAKFTNIYADIVANLASKPFSEEVQLDEAAPDAFKALAEDIDGRGNNLHVFAAETFFAGINYAIDWILVEFTKARQNPDGRPLSIAEERAQGLRPYWVRIPAKRMLAAYTDIVGGKEVFVHARIQENVTRRSGFDEETVERVRVLNREPLVDNLGQVVGYAPATFEVYEKRTTNNRAGSQWELVDSGFITIGEIALVPFVTGRRKGASWQLIPPMRDAAFLQIEHYQQESGLKNIKNLTAFPMLAGNGVEPERDASGKPRPVPVGPRSVLYALPIMGDTSATHGEWKFIEPTAESLKFLAADIEATEKQLRELGRQPLTATAGITVVTAALASQKASSAVQAWAWALKDAIEQAFMFTAKWLKLPVEQAPQVRVFTDFALETSDESGPEWIRDMAKRGRLSTHTEWAEAQRRGVLSGDFNAEDEDKAIEDEAPDPDDEAEITAAMGGRKPPPDEQEAA